MDLPARAQEIVNLLWAQHHDLAAGDADAQRELTRMIGEQLAFEFGPLWGVKSAGPGRPQGPSEIACNAPPLYIWRWSDGDGSKTGVIGAPLPAALLEPLDQTIGQTFIQVSPINHLGIGPARPAGPKPSNPDVSAALDRLDDLEQHVEELTRRIQTLLVTANEFQVAKQQIAQLLDDVERLHKGRMVARYWGLTIVSTWE